MDAKVQEKLARAKEILAVARHAAMATVNEDGSPHNTPYRFLRDRDLKHIFWGSHPNSQHSKNIERTGQVFVVLYHLTEGGGLYIKADNARALSGKELQDALLIHNEEYRKVERNSPIPLSYYDGSGTQRLYGADVKKLWIPVSQRDTNDLIIRDSRYEITASNLFS